MQKRTRLAAALAGLAAVAAVLPTGTAQAADTWTTKAYPDQALTFETSVGQPINADGSSNFKANGNGVIPVKFDLAAGLGAFQFESIYSDNDTNPATVEDNANDYSYVAFRPPASLPLADLTTLSAVYEYTQGDCGGGSLRWSVGIDSDADGERDGAANVYYGTAPSFTDCSGAANQSGIDLRDALDARVDTTQLGGPFYDTWAGLAADWPNAQVTDASLVLDGGWSDGDDVVTLTSATVNDTTFTPPAASGLEPTCDLPAATIKVTKLGTSNSGAVNEPVSIQPGDDDGAFRTVDCHYAYNLATSSLSGAGTYKVEAVVDGVTAGGAAIFQLR